MTPQPLPLGTTIEFNIAESLNVGRGTILAADYDDGWLYRIDVTDGDPAECHRNKGGELWILDSEITTSDLHTN